MAPEPDKLSLADLGKWPEPELGQHRVIRHAYTNALIAAARLHSFATGNVALSYELEQQQELLAHDDLVSVGIHIRRLIENTLSTRWARNIPFAVLGQTSCEIVPVIFIINGLVHHSTVDIIRTEADLAGWSRKLPLEELLARHEKPIKHPLCAVASERGTWIFRIAYLVSAIEDRILPAVIDVCDAHRLYLTEY